jgi:prepilin-type N-terminal cleavage/methylation domain-containing protein
MTGILYRQKRGFSLLELLLVMAIAAGSMMLLAPMLANGGKSAVLDGAGNLLADLINSARQNALSKNAMTAMIIVTDSSVDSRNRLFTMLELPVHEDNTTKALSSEWKQIAKWETLAQGVVVDANNWTSSTQAVSPAFPQLKYGGQTIALDGFQYLIFLPDGSTLSSIPTTVQLVEGYMPKGGTTLFHTSTLKNGVSANYYKLTVLNATGRIKIDRP